MLNVRSKRLEVRQRWLSPPIRHSVSKPLRLLVRNPVGVNVGITIPITTIIVIKKLGGFPPVTIVLLPVVTCAMAGRPCFFLRSNAGEMQRCMFLDKENMQ